MNSEITGNDNDSPLCSICGHLKPSEGGVWNGKENCPCEFDSVKQKE